MRTIPEPIFDHLLSLRGPYGTFEHAKFAVARVEHGYCTDDVARVALVLARHEEISVNDDLVELKWSSLHFLEQAQLSSGEFLNRRHCNGDWLGAASSEDCWGRALWALGTMYATSSDAVMRERALGAFSRGAVVRSPWPRSMAFSVLGAAEVLAVLPEDEYALALVRAGVAVLDRDHHSDSWRWPEPRLTYANAVWPEALLAAGTCLGQERLIALGLEQLRWLLESQTAKGYLSVTPSRGRGPHEDTGLFDQQPIEVAAMSDACVRAYRLTGDSFWRQGSEACALWFLGSNDGDVVMFDERTGGGYDGLTESGPNLNQGAESTIALLTTLQHARRMTMAPS